MSTKSGVNVLESPTDETSEDFPSGEGKSPSNSDGRPELNVLKEQNRKLQQALEKQQEQLAELLSDKETRLAELQDKDRLSSSEREEKRTLEQQINAITSDPNAKPWLTLTEKTSKTQSIKAIEEYDNTIAVRNAKRYAKSEEMPYDKFEKEIIKFVRLTDPKLMPSERLEEAYELFKERKQLAKERQEMEDSKKNFAEGKSVQPVQKKLSRDEQLKKGFSSEDETSNLLKAIAKKQEKERAALG